MKTIKLFITRFPEYYLLIVVFLAGYTPPFSIHPVFIALLVIITLQLIFKNKITGLLIASLFLLISIYMVFALFSEFAEFSTINADAVQLLGVGLSLIVLNLIVSGLMIAKYLPNENPAPA